MSEVPRYPCRLGLPRGRPDLSDLGAPERERESEREGERKKARDRERERAT